MVTPTVRLFIALWPTDDARSAVVEQSLLWKWPASTRLTQPARIHLTLHFIGSVPVTRMAELREALAVPFEPFNLVFDTPELWRGGLGVLCASDPPRALGALYARLAVRLRELKLPVEERPFRVHATLARDAWGAKLPASTTPIAWPAHEGYALVQSLPGGAGYETLRWYR